MAPLAAALAFALAGAGAEGDELRFAVLGHIRGSRNGEPHFLLDEIVAEVAEERPQLVFLTGDLIFGDITSARVDRAVVTADWELLDRKMALTGAEVHRTPGNHDVNDPVTRDVWLERYGEPGGWFARDRNLFVLLNSVPLPEGDEPVAVPRGHAHATELPPGQLELLRAALAEPDAHDRAFVFVHHVLWWRDDAPWWRDVHPLLVEGKVRAVFAGDLAPLKFSHVAVDGIDYVQAGMAREGPEPERLREYERARLRQLQLDVFPLVTVRGGEVDIDVRTVGAITSGRLTPAVHRQALLPVEDDGEDDGEGGDEGPGAGRGSAGWLLAALAAGLALGALWGIRRRR